VSDQRDRPHWARRIRAERAARDWSQADAVRALRAHSSARLPDDVTLLRNWKRWEAGTYPDDFYRPLVAKTFGTVTTALFPDEGRRNGDAEVLAISGADTLELVARLRASDLNSATLDALRITVDRICSEYPYVAPAVLLTEGQQWLRRITGLLGGRLTLAQHKEMLTLAGWLALLLGCVEYDLGERLHAESTRRSAMGLGIEAGNSEIIGWANELCAWFALTQGDYQGVLAASEAGRKVAGSRGVGVQLAAQAAKAWARIGDRRQLEVALDQGRALLESLPHPENLDHHFIVDPMKFDFYVMDCYRLVQEDKLAETYAREILSVGINFDGQERYPMRNAEARITLGVVAARQGDIGEAIRYGEDALAGERKSFPTLLMCSRELGSVLRQTHPNASATTDYLEHLHDLVPHG